MGAPQWLKYQLSLKLKDFSPLSQDLIAIQQIRECGAIPLIEACDIKQAIAACAHIWASLPGNTYDQPGGHSLPSLLARWELLIAAQSDAPPSPIPRHRRRRLTFDCT